MGPSPASKPPIFTVPPEEAEATREALRDAEEGRLMTLSSEDLARIADTGVWPDFKPDAR